MVIATIRFGAMRCAAKLGGPNDECLLEQASGFQVFEQRRNPLVRNEGVAFVTFL